MSYQPLARKYRPTRFAEMVGQDAVAQALANAIASGRVLPNIIFTGVRGVGKTTVARLYAKALNCESRQAGSEPCNACGSCEAIARGHHEDVLEIDGASNTGVNDVRALQETIEYAPQRSTYKVYIIDEVHMLSQAAFNALLKTLEERRPHVIFVFATTELSRVPETILSRCPTFHLRKFPVTLITRQLASILTKEGVPFEEKALAVIAREGHGSMRDALTLVDQAIALGNGAVTLDALGGVVSNLSSSPYIDLLGAMVRRDAAEALRVIAMLDQSGAELVSVVEEAAQLARHAFVVQGLGRDALDTALLGLDDAELERLAELARSAAPFDLNRIFRTLLKCRGELDGSTLDRFVLENYVFEWCLDPGLPDLDALMGGELPKGPPPNGGGGGGVREPAAPKAAPGRMRDVMAELRGQKAAPAPAPEAKGPEAKAPEVAKVAMPSKPAAPEIVRAGATAGPVAQVATAAPAATPAGSGPVTGKTFPETWRLLVDAWKQQKPLQARKLEEAHPVEYTRERIVLAVSEDSYASKSLLAKDEQLRIRDHFRELFGFSGTLVVLPKNEVLRKQPAPQPRAAEPVAAPRPISGRAIGAPPPTDDVPPPIDDVFADASVPDPLAFADLDASTSTPPAAASAPAKVGYDTHLPDTILTERGREASARRAKLIEDARNAPFTKEVLAVLGGTIEDVRIVGDNQ